MNNYTTEEAIESRVNWQRLEEFTRMDVQKFIKFIQRILEEEVAEHLGRRRSQRKSTIDCGEGYRNGYGRLGNSL